MPDRQFSAVAFFQIFFRHADVEVEILPVHEGVELISERRGLRAGRRRNDCVEGRISGFPLPVQFFDGTVFFLQDGAEFLHGAGGISEDKPVGEDGGCFPAEIEQGIAEQFLVCARHPSVFEETFFEIILDFRVPEIECQERILRPAPVNRCGFVAGLAVREREENIGIGFVFVQPPFRNGHAKLSGPVLHPCETVWMQFVPVDEDFGFFDTGLEVRHIEELSLLRCASGHAADGYGTGLDAECAHFVQHEFRCFVRHRSTQLGNRTDEGFRFAVPLPFSEFGIIAQVPVEIDRIRRNRNSFLRDPVDLFPEGCRGLLKRIQCGVRRIFQKGFIGIAPEGVRERFQGVFLKTFRVRKFFPQFRGIGRSGKIEIPAVDQVHSLPEERIFHQCFVIPERPFLERGLSFAETVTVDDRSHIQIPVVQVPHGLGLQQHRIAPERIVQIQQFPSGKKDVFSIHAFEADRTEQQNVVQKKRSACGMEPDGHGEACALLHGNFSAERNIIALFDLLRRAGSALVFGVVIQQGNIVDPVVAEIVFEAESVPFIRGQGKGIIKEPPPVFDLVGQRGPAVFSLHEEPSVRIDDEVNRGTAVRSGESDADCPAAFGKKIEFKNGAVRSGQRKDGIGSLKTGIVHRNLFAVGAPGVIPGRDRDDFRWSARIVRCLGEVIQGNLLHLVFRAQGDAFRFGQTVDLDVLETGVVVGEQTERLPLDRIGKHVLRGQFQFAVPDQTEFAFPFFHHDPVFLRWNDSRIETFLNGPLQNSERTGRRDIIVGIVGGTEPENISVQSLFTRIDAEHGAQVLWRSAGTSVFQPQVFPQRARELENGFRVDARTDRASVLDLPCAGFDDPVFPEIRAVEGVFKNKFSVRSGRFRLADADVVKEHQPAMGRENEPEISRAFRNGDGILDDRPLRERLALSEIAGKVFIVDVFAVLVAAEKADAQPVLIVLLDLKTDLVLPGWNFHAPLGGRPVEFETVFAFGGIRRQPRIFRHGPSDRSIIFALLFETSVTDEIFCAGGRQDASREKRDDE
ncbi:MAG: hypothetical protein BWY31_01406 [Lentisphaerae bacterium ADurb.Bin242]|nr:MAG: hypothetical protein BWY31_01406 [Lentisphaerae bacterium ADurb.Bin242]